MNDLALALLILLVSTVSLAAQSDKDAAAIRKVMDDQAAAWNRGDIEMFMQGYWRSEALIFVSGDKITRGWQKTLDNYKRTYDSTEKMGKLTFSDIVINILSKNAAAVVGSWSLQRTSDDPKGKFTLVFRKFKDGWRIIHDHTS